jgi:hypothetical protein
MPPPAKGNVSRPHLPVARPSADHKFSLCKSFAFDENSLVPLTLSFQHVQFNKGGARNWLPQAHGTPTFPEIKYCSQREFGARQPR